MAETNCLPMLKALADDTRFRMVRLLLVQPLSVNEIAGRLSLTQYNTSKHLRILREAGWVKAVKQGRICEDAVTHDFRRRIAGDKDCLDLGCCSFRFDRVAKKPVRGLTSPRW